MPPVGSKIASIMLEIKFYIIQVINPVLANATLFWRFGGGLIKIKTALVRAPSYYSLLRQKITHNIYGGVVAERKEVEI